MTYVAKEELDLWHQRLVRFRGTRKPFIVTACLYEEDRIVIALAALDYHKMNPDWTAYHFTQEEFLTFTTGLEFIGSEKHPELSNGIIKEAFRNEL